MCCRLKGISRHLDKAFSFWTFIRNREMPSCPYAFMPPPLSLIASKMWGCTPLVITDIKTTSHATKAKRISKWGLLTLSGCWRILSLNKIVKANQHQQWLMYVYPISGMSKSESMIIWSLVKVGTTIAKKNLSASVTSDQIASTHRKTLLLQSPLDFATTLRQRDWGR